MARQEKTDKKFNGRELQKNRTRKALVASASELLRNGKQPTVTDAAEAAGISRATAYRYFPSQEMLWVEVALFAADGPIVNRGTESAPAPEAIADLVRGVGTWSYENERPLRALLRLSLDPDTGIRRPGHRVEWIANTLAPVRGSMDTKTYNRLSRVLTLMLGIDPVVVMTDIAGVNREQALDALEWSARTLVEAALRR